MMKKVLKLAMVPVLFFAGVAGVQAERYWADEVSAWTGSVQNYAGVEMTTETTWWLTGAPDADQDENGYAWDTGDQDSVAGWRSSGNASVTVWFETAIDDLVGEDLEIVLYSGLNSLASVWVSTDDSDYLQLGTIDAGQSGYLQEIWFDFDGQIEGVHYVKIVREVSGPQTGLFVDAIGATIAPEPSSFVLLLFGGVAGWMMIRTRNRAARS